MKIVLEVPQHLRRLKAKAAGLELSKGVVPGKGATRASVVHQSKKIKTRQQYKKEIQNFE